MNQELSQRATAKGMRLSILEAVVFALMMGFGEVFFLADAIRLSASRLEQALVVTVPLFVGAFGPLLSVLALSRMTSRKPLVCFSALFQGLILAALSWTTATGNSSPLWLISAATLHGFFGQSGGVSWSSWFGDLVPEEIRGRYFARRNRWGYGATFVAIICAGLILDSGGASSPTDDGATAASRLGFAVIYGIASLCRFASCALHVATPEPRFRGLTPMGRTLKYARTKSGKSLIRLLWVNASFYLAVYIASPYFAPFMLEELDFSYLEYTAATTTVIAVKVLVLSQWGRTIDHLGPRAVYFVAALIVGLIPLPYLWTNGLAWVLVGQVLSGLSWAAYELSLFSLLLDRTHRRIRPHVFALQSILNGSAQLLGSLLGAVLLASFGWIDLRMIFAISMGLRIVMALAMPRLVPEHRTKSRVRRRAVLMRMTGFRPSGGLVLSGVVRARKPPNRAQD